MTVKEIQTNSAATPVAQTSVTPDRLTMIAFLFMVLVAGGAAVAIRITFAELPPFWSGGARFGLAALIFWVLMLVRKVALPRGKALAGAALFGFLGVGASFLFLMWGLVETPASLFQVIGALVPLLTILFAFLHRLEKLRWRGIIGALLPKTPRSLRIGPCPPVSFRSGGGAGCIRACPPPRNGRWPVVVRDRQRGGPDAGSSERPSPPTKAGRGGSAGAGRR